jgi:DNA invertase Pin-like site-specific DNA recombinase
MGFQLDDVLKDIGVSGFSGENRERGALGRFLKMVRNKQIPAGSHLCVESLDRLSRDKVMVALRVFSDILEAGIEIHTIADRKRYTWDSINANTADLIISITIMIRANEESAMKVHRQRETWSKKRADAFDKKLTAKCPSWLELMTDRRTFKVDNERKLIVLRIFEEAADGLGCDKIARRFNQEEIKPFSHGRLWHGGTVRAYLQSKAVLGHYQPNVTVAYMEDGMRHTRREPDGDIIKDYYPQIVSEELWHRAWASIDTRRLGKSHNSAGRKGSVLKNLFRGIAKCVRCGSPMNVRDRGKKTRHRHKPFLICSNARNGICANNH